MKKILVSVSLLVLIMSVTCSALAWVTPTQAKWFNVNNVQCVNTTTLKYWNLGGGGSGSGTEMPILADIPYKTYENEVYGVHNDTSGRLYVYHTITGGGGNQYTNLFHAVKLDESFSMYGTLCGQKWVTPQMWIPIQSNAIEIERHYSVAVRGNTKHNENYGATSVDFYIGVEANQ